jgi:CheY-like chemotaxis protein
MANVLVVDDETPIALLLESYLSSMGHTVTSARSSIGGIGWLDLESFDVVVLDVMMPGDMDGLDVCTLIKNNPRTSDTRVLIISGVPEMDDRARAAGADAFLPKPFSLEDIKTYVAYLAQRGTALPPGQVVETYGLYT